MGVRQDGVLLLPGQDEVPPRPGQDTVTYNSRDGTLQRFCETCLTLNSNTTSEHESTNHTGHRMSYQQVIKKW